MNTILTTIKKTRCWVAYFFGADLIDELGQLRVGSRTVQDLWEKSDMRMLSLKTEFKFPRMNSKYSVKAKALQ